MDNYEGRATLTLTDGTRVPGVVALRTRTTGAGRRSWQGRFRADDNTADVFNAVGSTLPIEISEGRTGTVLVQNLDNALAGQPTLTLVGSGEPPY